MITNTQACVASIQTYSKGINSIAEDTLAPINFLTKITNEPMGMIRVKGDIQQPSRKIILQVEAYDTVRKQTVLPIQDMKREYIMILKQKKIKLAN